MTNGSPTRLARRVLLMLFTLGCAAPVKAHSHSLEELLQLPLQILMQIEITPTAKSSPVSNSDGPTTHTNAHPLHLNEQYLVLHTVIGRVS